MPIYEYRCPDCSNTFERYARTFADRPSCPTCGGADVARLLSTFAVSTAGASPRHAAPAGGCGEGPPCGAAHCGRLAN